MARSWSAGCSEIYIASKVAGVVAREAALAAAGEGIVNGVVKGVGAARAAAAAKGAGAAATKVADTALAKTADEVIELAGALPAKETAKKGGTELARELGRAGEEAAGIAGKKKAYTASSGRTIVPDEVARDVVTEVNNVKEQALTQQLRDYVELAEHTGFKMHLITRENTHLTKPLRKLIDDGRIIHKPELPACNGQ